MLNPNNESKTLEPDTVTIANCPVCSSIVLQMFFMQDGVTKKKSKWFQCSCGVVFQMKPPEGVYDEKYWLKTDHSCLKTKAQFEYPITIYAPIIEELIYGRKVLEVGAVTNHQTEEFKRRGWITYTIDKNTCHKPSERRLVADFETHEFNDQAKVNMVWMYHTLECFHNPKEALKKCFTVLKEDGILFIATPDTDFINTRASAGFPHWKEQYNHIMWNKRSLTSYLENLGFTTIMCRRNYERRFPYSDDLHGIFQKKFW